MKKLLFTVIFAITSIHAGVHVKNFSDKPVTVTIYWLSNKKTESFTSAIFQPNEINWIKDSGDNWADKIRYVIKADVNGQGADKKDQWPVVYDSQQRWPNYQAGGNRWIEIGKIYYNKESKNGKETYVPQVDIKEGLAGLV